MIVVVGLAFEARIAAASGLQVICAGDGRNLRPALHEAITVGCRGLISFGVAGGLSPDLRAGTCVVASGIVSSNGHVATDRNWSHALLQAMPSAVTGMLAGASGPVATPTQKRALHRATGALAVDTESHLVADVAAHYRLPMVALRVICDPAARTLPDIALRAIRADGTTDVYMLLRGLLLRPDKVPTLLKIAREARLARATLLQCRHVLGAELDTARADEFDAIENVQAELGPAIGSRL